MKFKKFFTAFALSSLVVAGALFASQSAGGKADLAKAETDVGEVSIGEVRNAISTSSALYLLPTQNYDLPDSWDYAYIAVGEEDGIFINGEKYNGSLKYAGTGSAFITFYFGMPRAAVEGDVVEFKGSFASSASGYSFSINYGAQRFAETWVHALEDYDVVSLKDANMPDFSNQAINTDDMGGEYSYTTDAAALPMRKGYLGLTNDTGSYAFQFNHKKTATGTGWAHVLIGGQGPLWRTGHFIDFGFLDAWANTGHAQIKEMRGNGDNWSAEELHATGAIALGWNVGETNLLEMGLIKVKGSGQHLIFFKVNGALKFSEYWTLQEGGMTTKVTIQYAGTDATFSNSIEPFSVKLTAGTYVPAAKQLYFNASVDFCPAINNWSDYFKSVDGQGLKLNGVAVGATNWNYFKKTGATQMFLALGDIGVSPVAGDVLYVGGMFKAAKSVNGVSILFKANFADSYFQFDGEAWHEINPNYEAGDFAKELLLMTMGICTGGNENNHDALVLVWATLAGNDHYGMLAMSEKDVLKAAEADKDIVVPSTSEGIEGMIPEDAIGAAMYRYDYCTAKYSLNSFIEGRPEVPNQSSYYNTISANENSNTIIIVVVALSALAFSLLTVLVIKKRKQR